MQNRGKDVKSARKELGKKGCRCCVSQKTLWSSLTAATAASKDTELTQGGAAEELRHDSALSLAFDFHEWLSFLKPGSQRQLDITLIMIHLCVELATDYFVHKLIWPHRLVRPV